MTPKRVAITGMAGISPLGHQWSDIRAALQRFQNAVQVLPEWDKYDGLNTRLGAPAAPFTLPPHFDRKATRTMGRVAIMGTLACEMALEQAGLTGSPLLRSGDMGIAFGSSSGSPTAIADFGRMILQHNTHGITAGTYVRMMPHTVAVNAALHLGLTGRLIPTSSACTSGSQGIGYAYEAVRYGLQKAMLAGGAEELDAGAVAVFDTLFATSQFNDAPSAAPRPFDAKRDGLVLGEGGCTFVLEEWQHAAERGATILGEVVGFGTNCDGTHITRPNASTMGMAMRLALQDANLTAERIGYVNAHGTATEHGDIAESLATQEVLGKQVPISSLKSYMGHTLGACGALETWMSLEMMRDGWFASTVNLQDPDPRCAPLDYIMGPDGRRVNTEYVMCNNFAFGGINTSLILRRVSA